MFLAYSESSGGKLYTDKVRAYLLTPTPGTMLEYSSVSQNNVHEETADRAPFGALTIAQRA